MEKKCFAMSGAASLLRSLQGSMKRQVVGRAGGIACGKSLKKGGAKYSVPMLTGRELEINRLLAEPRTLTSVAELLCVSRQTLRKHMDLMGVVKEYRRK
jgi:DNA-binding NarL/FixJ family response regulator